MTIPTLGAVVATIVNGAVDLSRRHRRARRNALTISYLQGMPAYLRNDIGLAPDAEIRTFVERGR